MGREHQLLQELAQGKRAAFDQIYYLYWEQLFLYVFRIIKNQKDAEDIIQDVFMTLWNIRESLGEVRSLKAYLRTISRNRTVKHMIKDTNREKYVQSFAQFAIRQDDSLEEVLLVRELSQIIDHEIANLPPKMREVFILSRKEYLSHNEISKRLGISDLTVKKHISRALKHLRIRLNG